jgi:hypothetical protein
MSHPGPSKASPVITPEIRDQVSPMVTSSLTTRGRDVQDPCRPGRCVCNTRKSRARLSPSSDPGSRRWRVGAQAEGGAA